MKPEEPKRGRPRLADTEALRSTVTVSLPVPMHDQLVAQAYQKQTSVSWLVREAILSHQRLP